MPGEALRINDALEPYPNFSILIDKLTLDKSSKKKRDSTKLDVAQMQKIINITQMGSNKASSREEDLHHGGYQREEAGQMQSFQSSLFDDEHENANQLTE